LSRLRKLNRPIYKDGLFVIPAIPKLLGVGNQA
jgi:hypothetical protein